MVNPYFRGAGGGLLAQAYSPLEKMMRIDRYPYPYSVAQGRKTRFFFALSCHRSVLDDGPVVSRVVVVWAGR